MLKFFRIGEAPNERARTISATLFFLLQIDIKLSSNCYGGLTKGGLSKTRLALMCRLIVSHNKLNGCLKAFLFYLAMWTPLDYYKVDLDELFANSPTVLNCPTQKFVLLIACIIMQI